MSKIYYMDNIQQKRSEESLWQEIMLLRQLVNDLRLENDKLKNELIQFIRDHDEFDHEYPLSGAM